MNAKLTATCWGKIMVVTHVLDTQKWTYCMLQDTKFQLPVYFHS